MAKWLDYEKMITNIYKELAPSANVTHNDKVMGKDSEIERQIDVTIRDTIEGENILIAVQAKDYQTPVDINTVGEFASVLRDIRASKGILVCNAGFTRGAMNLARSWGIDLCSAYDVESRNWSGDITIPVLWIDVNPLVQLQLKVHLDAGDGFSRDPRHWILSSDRGKTRLGIFETFVKYWNQSRIPKDPGVKHDIIMGNSGVELLVGHEKWQEVKDFVMSYTVNKRGWLKYFAPVEFRGIKNHLTDEVDFSRLTLGFTPFVRDDDWVQVLEPEQMIVNTKGIIVTSENFTIANDNIEATDFDARMLNNE